MRWLELIHLRTVIKTREEILRELNIQYGTDAQTHVYVNPAVATDISIHIIWNCEYLPRTGSPEGQRLAACLKGLCQVRHTVWQELTL